MVKKERVKVKLYPYVNVPKQPDPLTATGEEVAAYASYCALQEYTDRVLKERLLERYPKSIVNEIFERLSSHEIILHNKNMFLSYTGNIEDPDYVPFEKGLTLERFLRDTIFEIKRFTTNKASKIILTGFLINIARILEEAERANISTDDIYSLMNNFVLAVADIGRVSPIVIRVLDNELLQIVAEDWNINIEKYKLAVKIYYSAMMRVYDTRQKNAVEVPRIEVLRGIYYKRDFDTLKKIERKFKIPYDVVCSYLEDVDIRVASVSFLTALEALKSLSPNKDIDTEDLMRELISVDYVENSDPYVFPDKCNVTNDIGNVSVYNLVKKVKLSKKYVDIDFFRESKLGVYSSVYINCTNCRDFSDIEPLVDCANRLNLLRVSTTLSQKGKSSYKRNPLLKIVLFNYRRLPIADLNRLRNKLKELRNSTGKDIIFELQYWRREGCDQRMFKQENTGYIRVISDIHADINEKEGYTFNFGNDFIVNCGDTSGDAITSTNWIRNNMRQGVFVHGNHLGYSGNLTLNESINYYEENFTKSDSVQYLNNSCYEYKGIIFIGCCLYTDFKLYGEQTQDSAMITAARGMNDFVYPRYKDENEVTRRLTPDDYEAFFIHSKMFLKEKFLEYKNKPIVVVTHFAPSIEAISEEYKGSMLNPAFAVDMTDLMNKYDNIRLWCFGHVHKRCDFICNKTRVVAEPFGYYFERTSGTHKYGLRINIEDIKSMKPWEDILKED